MKTLGTVTTVLTGKAVPFAQGATSAINKQPVKGRQIVSSLGLMNDEQGDHRFHGGIEKALHTYPSEHYVQWCNELTASNSPHDLRPVSDKVIVHFPCPTYCTLELTKAMSEAAPNLFRQGVHYYKIGVGLVDLASVSQYKFDLFSPPKINQSLLHTLNDLNRRYGRDTLFLAAQGFDQEWAMRRDFLTPQYTIKWHSLPQIKC